MDKSQLINMFVGQNQDNFEPTTLMMIKKEMEDFDESTIQLLTSTSFKQPTIILVIAIIFGWDRFFLEDIGMGLLKVFTCYGFFVWWLVDIISAKKRTQQYNYEKYRKLTMLAK